jgi:glycosyltransferase involved in cell wall biosynthesis
MNLSIIIATYGEDSWANLAQTRAAPSAAAQDAFEVLVGHDPDGTVAGVRNALAANAEGDWLCFLDADDELAPGFLGAMERALEQEPEMASSGDGLLLTPAVSYVRKGRGSPPQFNDRGIPLSQDNWLVVGTLLPRSLFEYVGGFGDYPHGFEDWSLWSKCWRVGARIVKVKDAIYRAHVNPHSKHRQGWRDRRWQVETHQRVAAELAAWTP